jgi:nickel-dependent lactate racemase
MRTDMIEAARLAKLDFTVQIVYNGKRQPVGVYAGDVEQAHIEACRYANNHYQNAVQVAGGTGDVVVLNRYPQVKQGSIVAPGSKAGGSLVYLMQNPEMLSPHHYLKQHRWYRGDTASWWDTFYPSAVPASYLDNLGQIIYVSQYANKRDLIIDHRRKNIKFVQTWTEALKLLEAAHKGTTKVVLYPYYPIQQDPLSLEGPNKLLER